MTTPTEEQVVAIRARHEARVMAWAAFVELPPEIQEAIQQLNADRGALLHLLAGAGEANVIRWQHQLEQALDDVALLRCALAYIPNKWRELFIPPTIRTAILTLAPPSPRGDLTP